MLWWLCIAARNRCDLLTQAFTLIVFQAFRLLHLFEFARVTLDIINTNLSISKMETLVVCCGHFLVCQEQKDALYAHAVKHFVDFCGSWWRVNGRLHFLLLRIINDNRIIVERNEEFFRLVIKHPVVIIEALAKTDNILLGDEIGGDQMTDEANFDLVLEYHRINLLINKFYILDGVCHCRVLNW